MVARMKTIMTAFVVLMLAGASAAVAQPGERDRSRRERGFRLEAPQASAPPKVPRASGGFDRSLQRDESRRAKAPRRGNERKAPQASSTHARTRAHEVLNRTKHRREGRRIEAPHGSDRSRALQASPTPERPRTREVVDRSVQRREDLQTTGPRENRRGTDGRGRGRRDLADDRDDGGSVADRRDRTTPRDLRPRRELQRRDTAVDPSQRRDHDRRWHNRWDRDDHHRWDRQDRDRDRRRGGRPYWRPGQHPFSYSSPRRYWIGTWRGPQGFSIHIWSIGDYLPWAWYGDRYLLTDWWYYGLPWPPHGYDWVRVGYDAVLVDRYTGRIAQVVLLLFW